MKNEEYKPPLKFDDVPRALSEILEKLEKIEKKMNPIEPPALGPDPIFNITIEDAADYLDYSIASIRRLVDLGQLDFRKIGKRLYFSRDTLQSFVTSETLRTRKLKKSRMAEKKRLMKLQNQKSE